MFNDIANIVLRSIKFALDTFEDFVMGLDPELMLLIMYIFLMYVSVRFLLIPMLGGSFNSDIVRRNKNKYIDDSSDRKDGD